MREIFQIEDVEVNGTLEKPVLIATAVIADKTVAEKVINSHVGDDGRSEWHWFRLANGDLILGTFPHGDTYFETEADINRP